MAILKNLIVNGVARVIGDLTASKIIKQGGVSSEFLKADGSVSTLGTAATKNTVGVFSSLQHSDYNNNQGDLITRSFMSYWNGAYNSNGASNLTYCVQGTIIGSNNIGNQSVKYATSAGNANGIANSGMLDSQEKIDNFISGNIFKYATFKTTDSNNLNFGSNDGMILSIPWPSADYGAQMAFDDTQTGTVKIRCKSGTWGNWYTLLHSGNYNSYAPTKTGTGASGTWNISISGNAATATSAQDTDKLDGYHATCGNNKPWGTIPVIADGGYMDVGKQFEFHYDNTTGSDFSTALVCTGNYGNAVNLPSASGTLALTSQIPTKASWNYDDRYAYSNVAYYYTNAGGFEQTAPFWFKFCTLPSRGNGGEFYTLIIEGTNGSDAPQITTIDLARSYNNDSPDRGWNLIQKTSQFYFGNQGCVAQITIDTSNNIWLYYDSTWKQNQRLKITIQSTVSNITILTQDQAKTTITTVAPSAAYGGNLVIKKVSTAIYSNRGIIDVPALYENGVKVSVNGHTHKKSEITDFPTNVSAFTNDAGYKTTDTTYTTATSNTLGLVKIGYTANGKNYPVQLSNGQMYVNVPWTDTTYNFSGTTFYSGNSDTAEHDANNATTNGHYYYTSNGPSGIGNTTTDGALYVQSYSDSWVGQIAQDYRNGRLFVRGKNNGSWTNWLNVLDSSNYSSFALPLTGGTITGTLTINRDASAIHYNNSSGVSQGWLGFSAADTPSVWVADGSTRYNIIHSGNIGSQSVNYATSAGSSNTATIAGSLGDNDTINMYAQYSNEINFGGGNSSSTIYFGYRATDSRPIPTEFIFGNTTGTANLKASKFIKTGSSDSYVLLGAGGHKALSNFIQTSGDQSISGTKTFTGTIKVNRAESTTGFFQTSDIRYKNIIEYYYSLSDKIAQLPIIKYKWTDRDDDSIRIGSSAQSIMSIIPELVSYDDNTDFYSLDYATLGAVAGISACKEVEILKQKIKELEQEIIILKSKYNG